jgi:hypothetical protein
MSYELWDTETANLLGTYPSKEAALRDVSRSLRARGRAAIAPLALAFEDATGGTHPIAAGAELIELAENTVAEFGQAQMTRAGA